MMPSPSIPGATPGTPPTGMPQVPKRMHNTTEIRRKRVELTRARRIKEAVLVRSGWSLTGWWFGSLTTALAWNLPTAARVAFGIVMVCVLVALAAWNGVRAGNGRHR